MSSMSLAISTSKRFGMPKENYELMVISHPRTKTTIVPQIETALRKTMVAILFLIGYQCILFLRHYINTLFLSLCHFKVVPFGEILPSPLS